jgi:hypothetical protein
MYAVGVCWKSGGWMFSIYMRMGDTYPTLKVRRVKCIQNDVLRARTSLKVDFGEVFEAVRRFGKA